MNYPDPFMSIPPIFLFIIFAWSLFWKGMGLWKASKNDQKIWFVVMLVLSTFGILEIIYLFVFAKKKMRLEELKFWETRSK